MLEENPFSTRVTHALDHRSVIHGVREKDTTGKLGTESGECSVICDVAGRKDECCGFPVKVCEFLFERKMNSTVSCYITGTTSAMTVFVESTAFEINK